MDFEPLIKLLNTDEKSIAKSVLVSFPSIYLILYLFVPEFHYIDIAPSIIISIGVTTLSVLSFILANKISKIASYTNITIAQIAVLSILSIIIGYFTWFRITTIIIAFFAGLFGAILPSFFQKNY